MGTMDRAIAALKAENARLTKELEHVRSAIAALTNVGKNGSELGRIRQRRQLSPAARRRIVAAQKARWAKWRARQNKAA